MEVEKQKSKPVLPAQPTFGEKVYDFVFNNLINFWLNLGISAVFTFWVNHSIRPFMGRESPMKFQHSVTNGIRNALFKNAPIAEGTKRAKVMADALTLTTAGTVVMIPSVWIGNKIKAPFIKFFDRMRYGEANMQEDQRLRERHEAIENEKKPTLLGAAVGRLGTMAAVQLTAYAVGHKENYINKYADKLSFGGKPNFLSKLAKKFGGVDPIAGDIGQKAGTSIRKMLDPKAAAKVDGWVKHHGYSHSEEQLLSGAKKRSAYKSGIQDFTKYLALDTLYTLVTSTTIHPFVELLRHLPGMSYTNKPKKAANDIAVTPPPAESKAPIVTERVQESQVEDTKPRPTVSKVAAREQIKQPEASTQIQA